MLGAALPSSFPEVSAHVLSPCPDAKPCREGKSQQPSAKPTRKTWAGAASWIAGSYNGFADVQVHVKEPQTQVGGAYEDFSAM